MMAAPHADLCVVIPTHQRSEQTLDLLKSLGSQHGIERVQVLVMSNLPDAQLERKISFHKEALPLLEYHVVGTLGVNLARNLGLDLCRAPLIYFLDDDCVLNSPDLLARLLGYFAEHSAVTAVGGSYLLPACASLHERTYHLIQQRYLANSRGSGAQTSSLLGGNACYRLQDLGAIRFDPKIVFGGAEISFNRRLVETGRTLHYSDEFGVTHFARVNALDLAYKAFCQGRADHQTAKTQKFSGGFLANAQLVNQQKNLPLHQAFGLLWGLETFDFFYRHGQEMSTPPVSEKGQLLRELKRKLTTQRRLIFKRILSSYAREAYYTISYLVRF